MWDGPAEILVSILAIVFAAAIVIAPVSYGVWYITELSWLLSTAKVSSAIVAAIAFLVVVFVAFDDYGQKN